MIAFLQSLIDALSLGSIYALVALGIGMLFGILRLINFAHGDLISLGAYALIVPSAEFPARVFIGDWHWSMMVPIVCLIVMMGALISDALVFRPLRNASPPTLMITSFAVSYFIQSTILMIYGPRSKAVNLWPELGHQIEIGPLRIPMLQIVTLGVTIVLMIALSLFLRRTRFGVQMRAAADDFRMAQYLGVRADLVIGLAFALSGILAGCVSLLFLCQTGEMSNTMGVPLALFAFVATVVGGMGSLVGAVGGGYFVGFAVVMFQAYLPEHMRPFRDAFAFALLIVILLFRPQGLIASRLLAERV